MNSVSDFKANMTEVVRQTTLNESNWRSENWSNLWKDVDQNILNDAFEQHGTVQSIFQEIGEIIPRKCKSIARVEKKMTEQPNGRENYFKVLSDFVAVRIHCDVNQLPAKIDRIREIVLANDSQMHVRGSSTERPYGFCTNPQTKEFTDITQYVYIFIEKIGYPVEIQIGHEFASHTFTIDSALRDDKTCGKVDLWNQNFYSEVKNYILEKANDSSKPVDKSGIQNKAAAIHEDNVPADLQMILDKL